MPAGAASRRDIMSDGPKGGDDGSLPRQPDEDQLSLLRAQAVSLYRAARWQEAFAVCRRFLDLAPREPQMLGLAGTLALRLDDAAAAAAFFEAAIALRPDIADLHYNLGNALTRLGRTEEAVAAYRRAATYRPDLLPIHNNLGIALQSLGRCEEAVDAFQRALTLAPGGPELYRNLGIALEGAGRRDEAIAAYRRALSLKRDWPSIHRNLANALLAQGDARATVEICDAWHRIEPEALEPLGLKAVALDELGDRDGARRLVDLDRFVRHIRLETAPPGYDSLDAFNKALAQHLLADPTLAVPAERDVHYHGPAFRTTGELFDRPTGPLVALEAMIRREIADYLATVARADPTHPYLARPPRRWRPIAQATVLDYDGNLAPHVHYSGYVSGVYYVQIPDFISAERPDHAGWFEIGRPPARFLRAGRPEVRFIQPREGAMILFPSYFYHSTVPFAVPETRISIAFDALPEP